MANYSKNLEALKRAKQFIPAASQVYSKSYKYFCEGAAPVFADRGLGSHLWDIDGNEFIDTILGLGAVTVGYNDERVNNAIRLQLEKGMSFTLPSILEAELAETLAEIIPSAEMVKLVKNGSDATTAAVRLARAHTGREMILTCGYHGWHDWSIGLTEKNSGVPLAVQKLTQKFKYNDLAGLEKKLEENKNGVACVIMEPIQLEFPQSGYLEGVRALTHKHGALLIFDEVVTGFRFHIQGAQGYFNVTPDLSCFGKGMANGAAVSAVVGRRDVMRLIEEGVFISSTFGGEALSLAAALETIAILKKPESFEKIWEMENLLLIGLNETIASLDLGSVAYTCRLPAHTALLFKPVSETVSALDIQSYFQQEVLKEGILYMGVHNFCLAHSKEDMQKMIAAYSKTLKKVKEVLGSKNLENQMEGAKIRPVFTRNE